MLIPYNMRDGILICEGLSNPEWNYSAPHGAGRNMSRAKAKKTLDVNTYKRQMTGIYSTTIATDTLDESPSAYKDSRIIEEALKPTAVILNRIKPLINMKAGKIIREEH
jgi:RNA-splicing ligase RtcB